MKQTLTLLLCCLVFTSFSQLRVGVIGGAHQSEINETNYISIWNKDSYQKRTGGHFGFIADLPLGKKANVVFQPGVIYNAKGRKYSEILDTTIHDTLQLKRSEFLNYIDIPFNIVAKIKLSKKTRFIFGGGTYLGFFYNGNLKSETISKNGVYSANEIGDPQIGDGPDKYSPIDFGLNALAGFEFGRVFLTANYSQGLNNIYQAPGAVNSNAKFKHRTMGVSLGVFLGSSTKMAGKDRDGDGVSDKNDQCPDEKGSPALSGCPDGDSDGVPDKDDKCPNVWGSADNDGCPYQDKDGDGVPDKEDKCPTVAGSKENGGCPVDTDKDGVPDNLDKCPNVPGLSRYSGCPIPDTDGDGINDELDQCPTVKGVKENNGCPEVKQEIKQEIVEKVNYAAKRIQFKFAQAEISPESFKTLNEVVAILKDNKELKLTIEGHTSADGIYEQNMKLSTARAEKVKEYLISKGISAERLTAIGYGPTKLLNPGKTEAEKAQNRRVELKLSN
jgi:OOP family OmpA-OmpF porin